MDFDPLVFCKQVTCPVMIVLGELDRTVPIVESTPLYEQVFDHKDNPNLTMNIFPSANHGLRLAKTGSRIEYGSIQEYVPGYFEIMVEWVSQL
jgi:dipeptidyl aminopeptidase/acylaminoacyl peptidase